MTIRDQLEAYAYNGNEAVPIVKAIFEGVIATLQRDPRITLSREDLELLLADQHAIAEDRLIYEFVGLVSVDYADFLDGGES